MPLAWIVDDDEDMSHAVTLMLQLLDYQVQTYRDARVAARRLAAGEGRPDLVILDINMPEVTGIDMLEYLRRPGGFPELPVVMLSSETTDVQVDEAYAKGADAFVFKPVTIEELEGAIRKARAAH
jgi:DNA-binding response OmpR family regulator